MRIVLLFFLAAVALLGAAYRVRTGWKRKQLREAWKSEQGERDRRWREMLERRNDATDG